MEDNRDIESVVKDALAPLVPPQTLTTIASRVVKAIRSWALTEDEWNGIEAAGKAASVVSRAAKTEKVEDFDHPGTSIATWDIAEACHHAHNLQHMLMAQAASRIYPKRLRALGGRGAGSEDCG